MISLTIRIPLFAFILFDMKVEATFGFGGCYCPQPPVVCPPEPVCAPTTIVEVPSAPVLSTRVITPIAAPVQVPTVVGSACCSVSCYEEFDYYQPYPCFGCKKNRRRRFKHWREFKRSRRRRSKRKTNNYDNAQNQGKTRTDPKCNSEKLRTIMKKAVGMKTSTLKRNLQMLVEKFMGSQYNVLCGKGEFSYTTTTDEYCQTQVMDRICYVFRRTSLGYMDKVEDYDEIE